LLEREEKAKNGFFHFLLAKDSAERATIPQFYEMWRFWINVLFWDKCSVFG
jgi:hypothetical protein